MFSPNFNVFPVNGYFINETSAKFLSAFLSNYVTKISNMLPLNVKRTAWIPFLHQAQILLHFLSFPLELTDISSKTSGSMTFQIVK